MSGLILFTESAGFLQELKGQPEGTIVRHEIRKTRINEATKQVGLVATAVVGGSILRLEADCGYEYEGGPLESSQLAEKIRDVLMEACDLKGWDLRGGTIEALPEFQQISLEDFMRPGDGGQAPWWSDDSVEGAGGGGEGPEGD